MYTWYPYRYLVPGTSLFVHIGTPEIGYSLMALRIFRDMDRRIKSCLVLLSDNMKFGDARTQSSKMHDAVLPL